MDKMLSLQHELASLYRRLAQVVCDMNELTCKEFAVGGNPQLLELHEVRVGLEHRVAQVREEIAARWGEKSVAKPPVIMNEPAARPD